MPLDQRKRLIANLVQLNNDQDPAWETLQISYSRLLKTLDTCLNDHLANERKATSLPKPMFSSPNKAIFPTGESDQAQTIPEAVLFVEDITDRLSQGNFRNLNLQCMSLIINSLHRFSRPMETWSSLLQR